MRILSHEILKLICSHAEETYPEECCGFIFTDGAVHLGVNIQSELNQRSPAVYQRSSVNGYTFSVPDTLMINRSFRSENPVAIIYHSHPDVGAYFSREDQDKALFMGEPVYSVGYLVIDVRKGKACGAKLFEWVSRSFVCTQDLSP